MGAEGRAGCFWHKTPMDVWGVGETAMVMPLCLDNAIALPTCPQPQQQIQTVIAA
jgi:hypothetical protein